MADLAGLLSSVYSPSFALNTIEQLKHYEPGGLDINGVNQQNVLDAFKTFIFKHFFKFPRLDRGILARWVADWQGNQEGREAVNDAGASIWIQFDSRSLTLTSNFFDVLESMFGRAFAAQTATDLSNWIYDFELQDNVEVSLHGASEVADVVNILAATFGTWVTSPSIIHRALAAYAVPESLHLQERSKLDTSSLTRSLGD